MFQVYAFINKLHLLNLIFLFILLLALLFSDFDSDAMILILIATMLADWLYFTFQYITMLADWLYFYLSVHNRPLLTFISGI